MRPASKPYAAATILDVAHEAGVSRTTVSRVLNEPERVPEETVERVRRAAETLNYRPSQRARSLRTGRTNTIALLVGDVSQPFQAALSKAVARSAEDRGLNVLLCDLDHSEARLIAFLDKLPRQGVDGIIIATGDDLGADQAMKQIEATRAAGIPVVLSGRRRVGDQLSVGVDFAGIASDATKLLLETGCDRPVLLLGRRDTFLGQEYVAGFIHALGGGSEAQILDGEYSAEVSAAILMRLFSQDDPPNGIVAATATMALGALNAMRALGLRVPEDIGLVVCEDVPLATIVAPAMTTVGVTATLNGEALVDRLEQQIAGLEANVEDFVLPHVVTNRASTRSAE